MLQGRSWVFPTKPVITATGTVVGPEEGNGPLGRDFDIVHGDAMLNEDSWEKAERVFMEEASSLAIANAGLTKEKIEFYIGGDMMNQIISSTFTARTLSVPYLGVFGACSTSMESLALAALLVDSGNARVALAGTCSHNSTAEKQFRYPTEYGSQKPPTAQFTVTGAGAAVVSQTGTGPVITSATIGKVVDMGIKDPFNMGAAMAPAAFDTIRVHLKDMNRQPSDYDLIVTGDLAEVGFSILHDLMAEHRVAIDQTEFNDCGLMIFDRYEKEALFNAGGSGAACCAVVTYGHIMKKLLAGEYQRVLVVATGALLSPLSFQQGESIPSVAHAVCIESGGE